MLDEIQKGTILKVKKTQLLKKTPRSKGDQINKNDKYLVVNISLFGLLAINQETKQKLWLEKNINQIKKSFKIDNTKIISVEEKPKKTKEVDLELLNYFNENNILSISEMDSSENGIYWAQIIKIKLRKSNKTKRPFVKLLLKGKNQTPTTCFIWDLYNVYIQPLPEKDEIIISMFQKGKFGLQTSYNKIQVLKPLSANNINSYVDHIDDEEFEKNIDDIIFDAFRDF